MGLSIKRRRMTSSLNEVKNNTGRTAYCGPYVVSAITGHNIGRIEDIIRAYRNVPKNRKPVVEGTDTEEVSASLTALGYDMRRINDFQDLPRKEQPTVWSWMQKPRNAWSHYILAIHKGRDGHWILIKGVKMCDTFTDGKWTFVCDGPHRGARIMEIFEVKKALPHLYSG